MKKKGPAFAKTIAKARSLRREMTPAEERLWAALRDRQLGGLKFRRQHPYAQFVLDFFCAERLLAVELDGGIHAAPAVAAHDAARAEFLTQRGVQVLRFTNAEVENNLPHVLRRILAAAPSPLSRCASPSGEGAGGEG
ncbi:MAG: endonuclease domain-containing protein [Chloroflexi bacterium]|nr:endonuclease domain-containing protein [Chloroflexota bacterium]